MESDLTLRATRTPYLYVRGQTFYFRAMLPAQGADEPRKSLCISLRTSDKQTAKVRLFNLEYAMAELIKDMGS